MQTFSGDGSVISTKYEMYNVKLNITFQYYSKKCFAPPNAATEMLQILARWPPHKNIRSLAQR